MRGNRSIETLDLSDNELNDKNHSHHINAFIKSQSERRDNELWTLSLRQQTAEEHLKMRVDILNFHNVETTTLKEIDSDKTIRRLLENLNNSELQTQHAILDQQAHLINFKRQRIIHYSGLREIILMRNQLGDVFGKDLKNTLMYDKYLKVINVAGNKIGQHTLKLIVKLALMENNSIVAFDARLNPGCTEKVERQLALCMLKNIEKLKAKGITL